MAGSTSTTAESTQYGEPPLLPLSKKSAYVYDLKRQKAYTMPKWELDRKVGANLTEIKIPRGRGQVAVRLGDSDAKAGPKVFIAAVHIPPMIRFQRVFGRYDTLYVTAL